MAGFALPHDHGEGGHIENLHRELMNVAHFTAVSEIFKQLSDPTRVRIFWLLSHQEERRCLKCQARRCRTISAR